MEQVTVRPAEVGDAEGFVHAYEASWDAAMGAIAGRPLDDFASFEERLASFRAGVEHPRPDACVWVAERGREVVGVAVRVGSELQALYVVPESWGTGVANRLTDAALTSMREAGATEATLWVVEANARARRFYEREGWQPTGETRDSQLGPAELQYRRQVSLPIRSNDALNQ
jgi:GNAT superfamily N-acetyltransferase